MENVTIDEAKIKAIREQQENKEVIEEAGFDKCFTCGSENIFLVFENNTEIETQILLIKHICNDCNTGFQKKIDVSKMIIPVMQIITSKRKYILLTALRLFKSSIEERLKNSSPKEIDGRKQITLKVGETR